MTVKSKTASRPRAKAGSDAPKGTSAQRQGTPLLEWIAAGTGLLFLVFLLSAIAYDAISGPAQQPPAIEVRQGAITRLAQGYVVAFEAVNHGDGTAAGLEIEAQLVEGASVIETSSATMDYVPGHGAAKGGFFFSRDPRQLKLKVRPLGFQAP